MVIFVGDKPSLRMKPGAKPFEGAACETRLHLWISQVTHPVRLAALSTNFKLYNTKDLELMAYITVSIAQPHAYKYVALGNVASEWLWRMRVPHFKLPHPSGRNRQINDKQFIANKLSECRKWIQEQIKV